MIQAMKKLIFSLLFLLLFLTFSSSAYAAETSLITGSNTTGSYCIAGSWNIYTVDDNGAQAGCNLSETEILKINTFDISSVPTNSIITGIKVVTRIANFNGDDDLNVNYTPYVNVNGTCTGIGSLISQDDIAWAYRESLINVSSCGLTDSTDSVNYITLTDYDLSNNAGAFDIVGIKIVYSPAPVETPLITGSSTTGSYCMAGLWNIYAVDDTAAQSGCNLSEIEILKVNSFDISSIPSGSSIKGIKVVTRISNANGDDDPNVNYIPYVNVNDTCTGTGPLISQDDIVWTYRESLIDISSCGLTDSTNSINYITLTDYDFSNNAGYFDIVGIKVLYEWY